MAIVEDKRFGHNYDGIDEYDNPMPPWWVYLFLVTVIWGGLYIVYFHFMGGPGSKDEYNHEIQAFNAKFAAQLSAESKVNWNEPNFEVVTDKAELENAKNLFLKNCISCHGASGQGGIGPNLTDKYWIHGGGINNIAKTIALGVPEKGMITWKNSLKKKEILELASYIITLQGTNPANAKAPQGDLFEEKK
jgi:cytochrome c oxidase cbb3-type subunit III